MLSSDAVSASEHHRPPRDPLARCPPGAIPRKMQFYSVCVGYFVASVKRGLDRMPQMCFIPRRSAGALFGTTLTRLPKTTAPADRSPGRRGWSHE
jgi:hypothetical protein